jgi:hypothetical protein
MFSKTVVTAAKLGEFLGGQSETVKAELLSDDAQLPGAASSDLVSDAVDYSGMIDDTAASVFKVATGVAKRARGDTHTHHSHRELRRRGSLHRDWAIQGRAHFLHCPG